MTLLFIVSEMGVDELFSSVNNTIILRLLYVVVVRSKGRGPSKREREADYYSRGSYVKEEEEEQRKENKGEEDKQEYNFLKDM